MNEETGAESNRIDNRTDKRRAIQTDEDDNQDAKHIVRSSTDLI